MTVAHERQTAEQRACVETYSRELHAKLVLLEFPERRKYIWRQIGVWTRYTTRLHDWATSDNDTPSPFNPPLNAWICSEVLRRLHGLLAPAAQSAA